MSKSSKIFINNIRKLNKHIDVNQILQTVECVFQSLIFVQIITTNKTNDNKYVIRNILLDCDLRNKPSYITKTRQTYKVLTLF